MEKSSTKKLKECILLGTLKRVSLLVSGKVEKSRCDRFKITVIYKVFGFVYHSLISEIK